jgi:capsid protein
MQANFAPELEMRSPPRQAFRNQAYEAGSQSRRLSTWRAPASTANAGILANLSTLRDRSRQATRNDGYSKGVID